VCYNTFNNSSADSGKFQLSHYQYVLEFYTWQWLWLLMLQEEQQSKTLNCPSSLSAFAAAHHT